MDRKVKSFRVRVDLLEWIESYAMSRGDTQIAVLEAALDSFRGLTRGGVPDLPPEEAPAVPVAMDTVRPSKLVRDAATAVAAERRAADEMRAAHLARQAKLNTAKYR